MRTVSLLLMAGMAAAQTPDPPPDPLLKWMNAIAQRQLDAREAKIAAIGSADQARVRQRYVREKILELIGGLPDYSGPLNARVTGTIARRGYAIEKVIFDSLPGLRVTANLYRPDSAGKYPGVLFALGHWEEGKPAAQQMAANLALKGFVVLAFDPVGQGEREQAWSPTLHASLTGGSTEQHNILGAQSLWLGQSFARYRIWDAKRALDYLASREEVDAERIGATGCSGGGTVATYISALDTRIKAAAPACYINSFREVFPGPTGDAEQSLPGFLAAGLDIADYIELFAPRPWLIGATLGDFFPIAGVRHAFDEARHWYNQFGADDRIGLAVGPGGHGTPIEVREAIYGWMIRWLNDGKGSAKESPVELLPDWQLWATENGHADGRELYEYLRDKLRENIGKRTRRGRAALIAKIEEIAEGPAAPVMEFAPAAKFEFSGRGDQILITSGTRTVSFRSTVPNRFSGNWLLGIRALMIGENALGMRIRAIRAAIDSLGGSDVEVAARGMPCIWAAAEAAMDRRIVKLTLDRMPVDVASAFDTPVLRNPYDALLFPGFALDWDFADLLDSRAVRIDPVDWAGTVVPRLTGVRYRVFDDPDRISP
jgi:hypothetical protein